MDFYNVFKAMREEYPENICLAAIQIYTLNLALKPNANFEQKILKKAKKVLWEVSEENFDIAVELWQVAYDWECRQSLQGMGGCVTKSFSQLIKEEESSK